MHAHETDFLSEMDPKFYLFLESVLARRKLKISKKYKNNVRKKFLTGEYESNPTCSAADEHVAEVDEVGSNVERQPQNPQVASAQVDEHRSRNHHLIKYLKYLNIKSII